MLLTIKRGEADFASVEIDENTKYSKRLMGEHLITGDFYSKVPLIFQIGDYLDYETERFTINRPVNVKKINNLSYKYKIAFEGEVYTLNRKRLISSDGLVQFPYVGTAQQHLDMLLTNINEIEAGWTAGVVDETKDILIDYNSHSCRTALTEIAKQFELEYSLNGKEISLKKTIGQDTAYTFEYGRGKGLYELEIKEQSNANIVTRMFGYGGTKNIPWDYRDRSKQLVFEVDGKRYLEKNTLLYGIREGDFTDDKIFPQRTSSLTAVLIDLENKQYYVEDSSIDFDIDDNLLEGMPAKIIFKSGQLTNLEFEIWKYDHENKRIYFNQYSEANGYVYPNDLNQPALGDEYTLVNIDMPQVYIDDNELELKEATQASLDKNCVPQIVLDLKIDPKYIKKYAVSLDVGYRVTAICAELGINSLIRIYDLSFPLVNPNEITTTIANHIPYTDFDRTVRTTIDTKKEVVNVDRRSAELARQNAATFNALKNYLLDADNEFDDELISAKHIKTLLAEIGTGAGNFYLNPIPDFLHNYGGDVNAFYAPVCSLIHLETSIEILDEDVFTWSIENPGNFSALTPELAYHLYAKCSKGVATAEWVLSPDIIASNQENHFYFPTGVLLPVNANTAVREFKTTYGKTYLNGREITTGRIQSTDGLNYIDLDTKKQYVGDANKGWDWGVSNAGAMTIRGAVVQSSGGATSAITVHRGAFNLDTYYSKDETSTYGGSLWRYKFSSPTSGRIPFNGSDFWELEVAAGTDGTNGTNGEDGINGIDGIPSYLHIKYSDNADGSNMNEVGGLYIGTYTDENQADSDNPADYTWVLVKGETGSQGSAGVDGEHAYLHIKYSNDGVNFTGNNGEDVGDWIGTYHDNIQLDSDVFGDYAWKKIKGDTGATGAQGEIGALPMGGKDYDNGKTYYGTSVRRDIVKYTDGLYYAANPTAGTFSGKLPTNTDYWQPFGGNYESLATDLLFASMAWIENLGVKYLRTATSGQRVFIDGDNGSMHFYNSAGVEVITMDRGKLTALAATIKTAVIGQRVEIDSDSGVIKFYNSANNNVAGMSSSNGYGLVYCGILECSNVIKMFPNGGLPIPLDARNTFFQGTDGKLYFINKDNLQTQIT